LQYHPHTCLQQKHAHIRGMLMPTKSAELLKAASVFSFLNSFLLVSDFIYYETEYFDPFLSAKLYFPDFGL
jgi:hypothetical protein